MTKCAYCQKETEYILLSCEDGSETAFCSWDCCLRFLASRRTEPIEYPASAIVDGKCSVCGLPDDTGEEMCWHCFEDGFVLQTAIMHAKHIDDIAEAWLTWKSGIPRKQGSTAELANCRYCGKIIWRQKWERDDRPRMSLYCSPECHRQALKVK